MGICCLGAWGEELKWRRAGSGERGLGAGCQHGAYSKQDGIDLSESTRPAGRAFVSALAGSSGSAALPASALAPSVTTASPAVPALVGSRSPSIQ